MLFLSVFKAERWIDGRKERRKEGREESWEQRKRGRKGSREVQTVEKSKEGIKKEGTIYLRKNSKRKQGK